MLEKFWKPKTKITVILKSGKEVKFKCDVFRAKMPNNELQSYEIVGGEGKIFYLRLDEIAAIVTG